jgi:hypothetical protein
VTAAAIAEDMGQLVNPAGPIIDRQQSKLLSAMLQRISGGRRITVLDVGPALSETVEFFSRYHCRLHFVDLIDEPFLRPREAKKRLSEEQLSQCFTDHLALPDGTQLDICLFGDFLNFLDDTALRAFNTALGPYLHSGTRAHGFGVHHRAVKLEYRQYGIIRHDTVSVRKRNGSELKYQPHSQIEMADMLSGFAFERGLLLPNGKLEMILHSKSGTSASEEPA